MFFFNLFEIDVLSNTYQQAFQLVECGTFRRLLQYCRPSLLDKDIPNCRLVWSEIINRAKQAKMKLREKLIVSTHYLYFLLPFSRQITRAFRARCHSHLIPGRLVLETLTCPSRVTTLDPRQISLMTGS